MFYADLEANHLPFTQSPTGILLRLIDDFLFITLSRDDAMQFLRVMHAGIPEYGATVKLNKSLVNFEARISGQLIQRVLDNDYGFPYCGISIHEKSLDIKRDRERLNNVNIADTLSITYIKTPGHEMSRKLVRLAALMSFQTCRIRTDSNDYLDSGFKLSAQAMYLDPIYNSRHTVLSNLFLAFSDSAMKLYRYSRSLSMSKKIQETVIISQFA